MMYEEQEMTTEEREIYSKGMKCLAEHLGDIESDQFIAIVNRNKANYTEWRRENLFKDMTLEELNKDILEYAKSHDLG